jgi:hypothetical protein
MISRRNFLLSSLLAAAWSAFRFVVPRAWAQTEADLPTILSDEDIDQILPSLTNWGRWGPQDQLGTLNFITPEMRLAAVRSIRTCRVVSLARERPVADPTGQRKFRYEMFRYLDPQPEESGCIDQIGMIYHGFNVTHLDALCHLFTPEGQRGMYNGFPVDAVTDKGAEKLGVEVMGRTGIVGRGVLLDIAALKGSPLPAGSVIMPADRSGSGRSRAGCDRRGRRHPLRAQRRGDRQYLRPRHRSPCLLHALAAPAPRRASKQRFRQRCAPAPAGV